MKLFPISKFIKRYLPEMILNIRGLRIAGQISRRKTKPLIGRENSFRKLYVYNMNIKNLNLEPQSLLSTWESLNTVIKKTVRQT